MKQLKASELREYSLTISESGLLVKGQYNNKVFVVFRDKKNVKVTIESTAKPEGPKKLIVTIPPLLAIVLTPDFVIPILLITPIPRRSNYIKYSI